MDTRIILPLASSQQPQLLRPPTRIPRTIVTWPGWAVTTRIDTWSYSHTVARAISCHRTQLPAYHVLEDLSQEQRETLWGTQSYYRAFSLVNGGGRIEDDLFAGLR